MNASVVLRLTVFAVMVALGVATGLHTGWSAPPPGKGVCVSKKCNKLPTVVDTSCPLPEADQKCVFTSSEDSLIYCDETTGSCEMLATVQPNNCFGYCQSNSGRTCYSTVYNKCKNPVPAD